MTGHEWREDKFTRQIKIHGMKTNQTKQDLCLSCREMCCEDHREVDFRKGDPYRYLMGTTKPVPTTGPITRWLQSSFIRKRLQSLSMPFVQSCCFSS